MADAINHDGPSTVATVGWKAAKWGVLGGVLALALPLGIGAAAAYGAYALMSAGTIGGIAGGVAVAALGLAAAIGTWGYASVAAIGGGVVGALKGSSQVSQENNAFRDRVMQNMQGRENKQAKNFNDGEVKGLQEGYNIGRSDGEQVGFQKGQEFVVHQIQQHMQTEAAAEQQANPKKFADTVACKCESKAEAIIKKREEQAATPNQVV